MWSQPWTQTLKLTKSDCQRLPEKEKKDEKPRKFVPGHVQILGEKKSYLLKEVTSKALEMKKKIFIAIDSSISFIRLKIKTQAPRNNPKYCIIF